MRRSMFPSSRHSFGRRPCRFLITLSVSFGVGGRSWPPSSRNPMAIKIPRLLAGGGTCVFLAVARLRSDITPRERSQGTLLPRSSAERHRASEDVGGLRCHRRVLLARTRTTGAARSPRPTSLAYGSVAGKSMRPGRLTKVYDSGHDGALTSSDHLRMMGASPRRGRRSRSPDNQCFVVEKGRRMSRPGFRRFGLKTIAFAVAAMLAGPGLTAAAATMQTAEPGTLTVTGFGSASVPAETVAIQILVSPADYFGGPPTELAGTPSADGGDTASPVVEAPRGVDVPDDAVQVVTSPALASSFGPGTPGTARLDITLDGADLARVNEVIDAAGTGANEA